MCTVLHGLGILRNGSLGAGRRYDFRIAIEKNMLASSREIRALILLKIASRSWHPHCDGVSATSAG